MSSTTSSAEELSHLRHEIKNHLSVILVYSDLLKSSLHTSPDWNEQTQHACDVIKQRVEKLVSVVDENLR